MTTCAIYKPVSGIVQLRPQHNPDRDIINATYKNPIKCTGLTNLDLCNLSELLYEQVALEMGFALRGLTFENFNEFKEQVCDYITGQSYKADLGKCYSLHSFIELAVGKDIASPPRASRYSGKFNKRFAKMVKEFLGIKKLSNNINSFMSMIGETTKRRGEGIGVRLSTEIMDWKAGAFGDGGSCFLNDGCRSATPELAANHGTMTMRLHTAGMGEDRGCARCFVTPFTFKGRESYILWNCYGSYGGQSFSSNVAAKVLQGILKENGLNEHRVIYKYLSNNDEQGNQVWINGGSGRSSTRVLLHNSITDEELKDVQGFDLGIDDECSECGDTVHEHGEIAGGYLVCGDCGEGGVVCGCCGGRTDEDFSYYIESDEITVCEGCYENNYTYCETCEDTLSNCNTSFHSMDNGNTICEPCLDMIIEDAGITGIVGY